jgi:iron complex outermembrane receptor protein
MAAYSLNSVEPSVFNAVAGVRLFMRVEANSWEGMIFMKFIKSLLCSSAALASLSVGGQAVAQDGGSNEGAADDGTIIVSARRVDERLQDVPISITALSADRLNNLNITGAESLAKFVPGLIATSRYSPEQASFSIRGFTQELRTSASVGTYFGEVVAPRGGGASISGGDGAGPAYLFDLQSVQVLKGPQGTLFGRNTTGGAILLIPNNPTDRVEGYLEGSYGNFNMFRIQGVLNIPVSDSIRLRIGADRLTRDGYMKNISGIGPKRYADIDYIAARASLAIDVTPDIKNTTIGTYMLSDHVPAGYRMYRYNPVLTVGLAAVAKTQIERLEATGDPYAVDINLRNPRTYTRQWQVINTTAWQLSDTVTLRNIASYSELVQDLRMNNFGSNFSRAPGTFVSSGFIFSQAGQHTNDQHNLTEELQLQGTAIDGRLSWQTGLYYERSTPGSLIGGSGASARANCLDVPFETADDFRCTGGTVNVSQAKISFINMAAYGQGTFALTEQLKLTAGLRYTYDRSRGLGFAKVRAFPASGAFAMAGPETCEVGYTGDCSLASRTSSKRATWTLNLAYNPIPDVMVYGTWTRGYRQGAVNPSAAPTAQTFDPETIDAYEIGAKTSFQGAISGVFNIAGYYNDLTNQQLQFALQPFAGFPGSNRTSNFNAGKSRIKGVEADASIRFGQFFRIDGSINRLMTKLISVDVPVFPNYTIIPTADKGGVLPGSPKWAGNVSGTVTIPVGGDNGQVEASALYRFQSSYRIQAASVTDLVGTPVRQVDLTLNWHDVMGAPIDLQLFANNVTKQVTFVAVSGLQRSLGFDTVQVGEPRTFGARLKVRFGEGVSN